MERRDATDGRDDQVVVVVIARDGCRQTRDSAQQGYDSPYATP
jgi:hypothetical protein